ncbi:MAG TPA: decaprenyl-phosphate phosphoribosyltransferase [Streptosporangiaceae bacterium]|nr:decaprenyl-phosphate phosphoribosyltransferase [Streptosporangiaceae bacterium]
MTYRTQETAEQRSGQAARRPAKLVAVATLIVAAFQAARPRQWPKNLLVFAAPVAGASLGRHNGFGYALVAFVAFTAAASAVYLINDVVDVERDRLHPTKRLRPIAAGRLPQPAAIVLALAGLGLAVVLSLLIREPLLAVVIGCYAALSLLYSSGLKHVPWLELGLVANGFVLRALGGAVATHVPPSGWFLTVCSFGALMVASGKRYSELASLGDRAAAHRPVMRYYSKPALRLFQRAAIGVLLAAYLAWALSESTPWLRGWHVASLIPLAAALIRFDWLTGRADGRAVEDLISRDKVMVGCELAWLGLFLAGLV